MAEATETFGVGASQVTTVLSIDLPTGGGTPLSGNVSGVYGDAHVVGDLNLTGDLTITGLLTGIDTFHCQGNGFSIFFEQGGRANLHGKPKAAWGPWGTNTTGWEVGDRIAVTPTAANAFTPVVVNWSGSWTTMTRPSTSPDVTLFNGTVMKPEVANLSQSIVFENLSRGWHIHGSGGVFDVSDVKVLNSGTSGVLSSYPIHFHQVYDNSRGSVLERVVVEGGKNHAFVPHGSHGISFPGCVAFNTIGIPFWWDKPIPNLTPRDFTNDSEDIKWNNCLAIDVTQFAGDEGNQRLAGFWLGSGTGLECVDSAASCVGKTAAEGERSGFHWPEAASNEGWLFQNCVAHNNAHSGIFTWQNGTEDHTIEDFTAYRNGYAGINHGAYSNFYLYRRLVLDGPIAVVQHAKSNKETPQLHHLVFEDIATNGKLIVPKHGSGSTAPTYHRRCTYSQVKYEEPTTAANGSYNIFEDCGLVPADFVFTSIPSHSVIEIFEGGVMTHRWTAGVWS